MAAAFSTAWSRASIVASSQRRPAGDGDRGEEYLFHIGWFSLWPGFPDFRETPCAVMERVAACCFNQSHRFLSARKTTSVRRFHCPSDLQHCPNFRHDRLIGQSVNRPVHPLRPISGADSRQIEPLRAAEEIGDHDYDDPGTGAEQGTQECFVQFTSEGRRRTTDSGIVKTGLLPVSTACARRPRVAGKQARCKVRDERRPISANLYYSPSGPS